jgi:uncharacterized protein YbjT (DUF2867 family)
MKIVVIGGTGLIGARLVARLAREGHEPVAASRRTGVDILTGEGLDDALRGASVVVDASNTSSFDDDGVMTFFERSTRNLLARAAITGVGHHVMVSVVGTGRLPHSAYLRAKRAQEQLIEDATVPYSIVQATQCYEFLGRVADDATQGRTVRVPPTLVQPIAADDLACEISKIATGTPLNATVEVGGPEHFYLDGVLRRHLGASGSA